jgi:hypothetical protein
MASYHHKPIKRFSLDGVIHNDSLIGRLKNEYIRLLTSEMRLQGYVPRIDIDTDFTIEYNEKTEVFSFELSVYGIYIGKKQAEWTTGIDGATAIRTQQNKSKEFSQEQV